MSTKVKISSMGFPFPLGKIIPGATFAAASAPLTQNYTPTDDAGNPIRMFNGVFITAWAGNAAGTVASNSGPIYICSNALAPDLILFSNVIAVLYPGDSFPRSKEWSGNRDIGTLYIGAENGADFAIASIDQF